MKLKYALPRGRSTEVVLTVLYLCATLQFARYYSRVTILYINMEAYFSGHERLPFQERVLPILFLRPLAHSQWVARHLIHNDGIYTAERGPFYLLSLLAIVVAGIFVQKLYAEVSRTQSLRFLVYPLFLYLLMWSYLIHNEADFSYPYDMPSVAFFAAGLYVIYKRQFLPLVFILLVGTFNRETTLFLIGIYVLDAASLPAVEDGTRLSKRFSGRQVPWLRVALLVCIWAAVKGGLAHHFAHNDNSENFVRVWSNLGRLKLRLWPALLNICGYMLPVVFLLRQQLRPVRFANYLYIAPLWFAVMFYTGVIVETRIYGELCPFVAVSLTVIIERHLEQRGRWTAHELENPDWSRHETAA